MTLSRGMCNKLALLAMGVSALSISACSTTAKTVRVAQGAPITYKVGEGAVQYASASTTTRLPRSSHLPMGEPSVAIPSPYNTPKTAAPKRPRQSSPQPRPEVDNFNPKRVDRDLYKHQKVGKKYKMMGETYKPKHDPKYDQKGLASWYGDKYHGKPTATGEIFDKHAMTAAHKTLPLNSMLHVTNLETGQSIMVRLNDRGPFVKGRIIDLSEAAARELGVITHGTARVRVRYAGPADPMATSRMVEAPRPATRPAAKPIPYRPVTPQASAPQSVALPTPAPRATDSHRDSYKPLRDYTPREYAPVTPAQPTERSAQPAPYNPAPYSPPSYQPSTPQHMTPQAPTALPQEAPPQGDEDNIITLTIKGPIHMAKNTSGKAQWIEAVNKTTYPK